MALYLDRGKSLTKVESKENSCGFYLFLAFGESYLCSIWLYTNYYSNVKSNSRLFYYSNLVEVVWLADIDLFFRVSFEK